MNRSELRDTLLRFLPIDDRQLHTIIKKSPHSYKKFLIPKKGGGIREIAQPARATKYLQRVLMHEVLGFLPVHTAAMAYEKNSSIKKNAQSHENHSYLVKMDFKNFFPSIKGEDVIKHVRKFSNDSFSKEALIDILLITCIKDSDQNYHLSIGAPSSPRLSNSMMFDFDNSISKWCDEHEVTYTRYADDLTFSTNKQGVSSEIEPYIRELLDTMAYPKIEINDKKTIHLSKKQQRRVTGLIINNEGDISLGRERKRIIRSMIHKYKYGELSAPDSAKLHGLLGLTKDVEPEFLIRMQEKYGTDVINSIWSFKID